MYPLEILIENLYEYLTGSRTVIGSIIRKHSKKLDQLGDLSFPLDIKRWTQAISQTELNDKHKSIFDYLHPHDELKVQLESLLEFSKNWILIIENYSVKDNSDVHLRVKRSHAVKLCIERVLEETANYGLLCKCFRNKVNLTVPCDEKDTMSLTELRMLIIRDVASNILNKMTSNTSGTPCDIKITGNSNEKQGNVIVCGSVLNESGVKDVKTTADELYKKRSLDMQLMAQHKYGVQLKPSWRTYFEKLGKSSVIIEMLQNRTHKAIKITLNDLQTTNKGPAFIFYNCARISALLTQFQERISQNIYPELPELGDIDFSLLNQTEEWELIYVYILQFPSVVINCISDIEYGIVNLHHLVSFLSNLSSVFSVYYRRIKILTIPKEHLLPVLYARIFLIKAVQEIFHIALNLLKIEPVREM